MDNMMEGMDWGNAVVALVLMALGLWFLVGGFWSQLYVTGKTFDWMVAVWYFIGIALVWYGKMWAHKSWCWHDH